MAQNVALSVLCIAVAGIAAQWLAWRLRLPAIVLLFAVGLLAGPGLQILRPAETFGDAMRPLVGLAVAIVVFEGGLALDFRELRAAGEGVLRLTALALPISFVFSSVAAHFLAAMRWGPALLFGAITVVTGPTVVLPLLRHTRLERRAASFLKWEAIVNDPIGALLAAIVLAVLLTRGESAGGQLAMQLVAGLALSAGLGVGAGYSIRWMVVHDQAPEVLKTPMLLALALGVYALSNLVMDEAGLAAATIFGITLANLHIPGLKELARFKEALVVLLVSALFVVLTASLDRRLLTQLSSPVLLLTLAMLFVVRPAAILLATLGSGLTWPERTLGAWIAPRGVVAAAVAGVASTQLASSGYHDAELGHAGGVRADRRDDGVARLLAGTVGAAAAPDLGRHADFGDRRRQRLERRTGRNAGGRRGTGAADRHVSGRLGRAPQAWAAGASGRTPVRARRAQPERPARRLPVLRDAG